MQNSIFIFGIIIMGYLILESYLNRKEVQKQQEKNSSLELLVSF